MSGRHPGAMRRRDERAHPVVKDAAGKGHAQTGDPYLIPGLASWEAANEARKSVYNAARHLGFSCSSRSGEDIFEAPDGTYTLRFRLFDKAAGRRHVLAVTGGDPANLAYNPFSRGEGPITGETSAENL